MVNIKDIREFMKIWKETTYSKGLNYCREIKKEPKVFELCIEILEKQNLLDKYMDGNSVENLPFINENYRSKVSFTDVFWKLAEHYITPASYIAAIVNECVKKGVESKEEITWAVGRGLRSLPAFFRELDLTYKIASLVPEAEFHNSPEQDIKEHTDIRIELKGQIYRLWSYQNSKNGLDKTAKKFAETRGELPTGIHFLCPIDIWNKNQVEEFATWYFYSDRYVKFLIEMMDIEKPDSYEEIKGLQRSELQMYLKKANLVLR